MLSLILRKGNFSGQHLKAGSNFISLKSSSLSLIARDLIVWSFYQNQRHVVCVHFTIRLYFSSVFITNLTIIISASQTQAELDARTPAAGWNACKIRPDFCTDSAAIAGCAASRDYNEMSFNQLQRVYWTFSALILDWGIQI